MPIRMKYADTHNPDQEIPIMETRSQSTSTTDLEIQEAIDLCVLNKSKSNGTLEEKKKEKSDNGTETEPTATPVSIIKLFRFAQGVEKFLVFLGILASWVAGLCMPVMIILFGRVTNAMVSFSGQNKVDMCLQAEESSIQIIYMNKTFLPVNNGTTVQAGNEFQFFDEDGFYREITIFGAGLTIVGIAQMVLSYIMVACLNAAAERQVFRIRSLFLQSVLRQDIGWYDVSKPEFASRTAEDLTKYQDGIGEKIGMFNFFTSICLCSVINAFIHGWELTLVTLSVTPVLIVAMSVMGKLQASLAENELSAYASSGSVAEEVLTAIRTVVAFGGEAKEVERYDNKLVFATKAGIKRGYLTGLGAGTLWFIIYSSYGLAFWYGVKLILDERGEPDPTYDSSTLLIVFFSVLMGAMNIGQSAPYIDSISQARAAASSIFDIIDRQPNIDSSSNEGRIPYDITGNIEFEKVYFQYPSRPDVQILNGFSLKINKGETVALVGESGCGKSTTVQLLQRFYDPIQGKVILDDCDIRQLNLGWLRDHIGIVGQEPILFGTTIAENIRYGRDKANQYDIETAAKEANAHDFIMKLPKRYETLVGDRGTQLSGGQKQRVAIARALIKNPKILLLDEATSALDSKSESVVQEALDKARKGRTTIIVAHRLSTVRTADKIAVISKGRVAELGSHSELMEKKGIYYLLVTTQSGSESDSDTPVENDPDNVIVEDHPLLKYQRSLSTRSDQSVEEILHRVSVALNRTPSLRCKKCQSPIWTEGEDEEEEKKNTPALIKILKLNSPEWKYIIAGCLGSLIMGVSAPAYALVFGEILQVLTNCDKDQVMKDTIFYSCMFLAIGAGTGIANFLQVFMFTYAGEFLTRRLRRLTFASILRQEIGWFDNQDNSVGALCTRLSGDAANVQGATGSKIGTILQSFCTLGVASVIALILAWKLSLIGMLFIPLVLVGTYFQSKIIMGQSAIEMKSLDKANKIAIEVISNIRTVASLHKEKTFHDMYMQNLEAPHKKALRNAHSRGFVFGFAQSTPYFAYAATIFYGGYLILYEEMDVGTVFKISELLLFGTMMVGQAFAFAPNANKGVVSAARILKLLEREPLIDSALESGLKLPENTVGQVEFKHVKFHYPSRPDIQVLRDLNLKVSPGEVLALVGSSGCGKSTCIQLLERFYDPRSGVVMMDGTDIGQLNIAWMRSRIGIVSQEPILFDCSIADNIAYGDNSRKVPMDEIIKAATDANIHNFIAALPQGYATSVGDKGSQLSGGQKQRIAIARALVRNPKILLLDEATSALDTESEKIVQEALEEAQKGRTCITVAHRLSTIKDAHRIAVIDQGKVVEMGTHDELLSKKGHYFKFYETQSSG